MKETFAGLANLPLNCPRCGKPMRYLRTREWAVALKRLSSLLEVDTAAVA